MPSYPALLLGRAFARWPTRIDLVSSVAAVLIPCLYAATGRPMPDNGALLISEGVVFFVLAIILGRLLSAPYLIWKEDQKKIAELQSELAAPERARRERFLDAQEKMRMELAKEIARYTDGTQAAFITHHYTESVRDHLESLACLFKHDAAFDSAWERFIDAMDKSKSISQISFDREDPDDFIEIQMGKNFDYYYKMRSITGRALVAHLTYDDLDWLACKNKMNELHERHRETGRVPFHDEASLDEVLARRSLSKPEQEKPH
jgi:hypothetical protein